MRSQMRGSRAPRARATASGGRAVETKDLERRFSDFP